MLSRLPKRLWAQVRNDLRQAAQAETRTECRRRLEEIAAEVTRAGQGPAAETVLRDVEDFLSFYGFPQEHWLHLRASNPIESVFGRVGLRTDAGRRFPDRDNAVHPVFKVVERSCQRRPRVSGSNLRRLVLEGKRFVDGKLVELVTA